MRLTEAVEMVGIDVAIVDPNSAYRVRVADLRDGKHGRKATLVAVGKYRLTRPGWCDANGYTSVEHGRNVAIVKRTEDRATGPVDLYYEVALSSLMPWSTYEALAEEAALRQAEYEIMAETRSALVKDLTAQRLQRLTAMPRKQRDALIRESYYRDAWRDRSPYVVVTFDYDPATLDTKPMRDLAARIAKIDEKLSCAR